jgi:hypothetical protein
MRLSRFAAGLVAGAQLSQAITLDLTSTGGVFFSFDAFSDEIC